MRYTPDFTWPLLCVLASVGLMDVPRAVAAGLDVIVAPVREVPLSDPIEALGTLRANESARLTATITETIAAIRFDDGQRVQAGQVLVALTNREQLAQLAETEAGVAESISRIKHLFAGWCPLLADADTCVQRSLPRTDRG